MIDFTTETERKRCKQIDKCRDLLEDVTDCLGFRIDTRKATNRLIKLRNYLNKELPDKKAKAKVDSLRNGLEALAEAVEWKHGMLCEEEENELGRALKRANDILKKMDKEPKNV